LFIGYLVFRTHILSNFHFNKMSDGVLYEGFGIMQASKNHFKTFTFLMEELPIRGEFECTV